MAELDTTVAGRHADGSPYNADGALLVTITNDEPAPRGPTPSDGNYSFDGVLQFHDDAETLSTADYSTASFAETETLPDGQVVGKLGEHSVPIPRTNEKYYPPPVEDSEQTTAPAAATATAPVAPEPDGSVARDVLRGVSTGAVKASNDLTGALSMILGAPSDITKSLLETFGFDAGEGILGSDNIEKNMNSFSSWVVENIPGVSDVDENFTAFNKEKANTGWVQNFSDGIGRFGIGAVTGPVQAVRLLGVANPIVRGLAWGGLTDFIQGAGSAKDEQTMLGELGKGLSSLTGVENEAWAKGVLSVFAKHETNSEITRRFKMALDGFVIGGAVDLVLTGLIRAVKKVPWRSMPKPDDMDVPQMSGQPDGGGDVAAALPAPVKVDDAVPVPEVQTRPATDLDPQGFFSAVSRAVDAIPMEKGSGAQMRAMIAKGEGVKAEEMAWTGLDDFLAGKKSVTKQEVRDYVDANQVQVEEVVKGQLETSNIRVELVDGEHQLLNDANEIIDTYPGDSQGALDAINAIPPNTNRNLTDTKFGEYTLPGGENYREVLLKLPAKTGAETNAARYDELNQIAARRNLTDAESDEMLAIEQAEFSGTSGTAGDDFVSGHFDEKNVLAHIRLNDRTGPNGERILFIEEIQSDWHQKGRKQGYKTSEITKDNAEIDGEIDDLMQRRTDITLDLRENFNVGGTVTPDGNGVRWYSLDIIENNDYKNIGQVNQNGSYYTNLEFAEANPLVKQKLKELAEIAAEVGNLNRSKRTGSMVPDAPLKKNWHEMSFRRVARMAAEEGYDAIAWTPGKVQAERYDLSKQIDELRYQKNDDGTFNIVPAKDGQTIQAEEFENLAENRLAEVVGKEVAEKIVKGEGVADSGTSNAQILRGVDLQVGGEGMKGFYDKMLKKYAEKWGKKFGSKVGVTKIARDYPEMADDLKLLDDLGVEATGSPHHEVWSMPVTPKMRDSVLKKGVPLFSAAGAAAATGAAMQNEKQPASERVF